MYRPDRAGRLVDNLSGGMAYKSFCPAVLPPYPALEINSEMMGLIVQANIAVALLDERAAKLPDTDLLVSMYVRKEALLSSQIEGTQATLEDIFSPFVEENANRDVADVVNYIRATDYALKRLRELPLCNRLLKEVHEILMAGARGQERNPGEFRRSQNWIGGAGSTIKTARYIPPNVDDMEQAMHDLESYINAENELDNLVDIALIHYQFETIHPFLDGNGRLGRLLITLYLMEKGLLKNPALYISYYLKANRVEYYDRMTEVRNSGNFEQWVCFFLQAVAMSAADAALTIDRLLSVREFSLRLIEQEKMNGRAQATLRKVFAYIEGNPIIEIGKTAKMIGVSFNTAAKAVQKLVDLGILKQEESKGKARIFSYHQYLSILREGTE